eukprot:m.693849 g.693849  ORF g.693849 m.693849 type:complete len:850 (+) comp22876_c0_seq3:108-2657(+)
MVVHTTREHNTFTEQRLQCCRSMAFEPPQDVVWKGILEAKDDLLKAKDNTMDMVRADIARLKALNEKLNKANAADVNQSMPRPSEYNPPCTSDIPKPSGDVSTSIAVPPPGDLFAGAVTRAERTASGMEEALRKLADARAVQIADLEGQVLELQEQLREEMDNSARSTRAADEATRMAEHRGLQVQLQLQEDVRRAQARVDEREQRILELERSVYNVSASRDEHKHRVIKLEDYMATLPTNEEYTERTEEVAQARHDNDLLRIRIEEAEAEVTKLTQELAARDDAIATCCQERDDAIAAQTAARVEHDHEVKMLTQQQEMLTKELERADAELRDCQDALSTARAECLGLQQKVENNAAIIRDDAERTRRTDDTLHELRSDIKRLQVQDREQQTTINALEDVNFSNNTKLNAQASTIVELRKALNALREANQDLLAGHVVTRTISIPAETSGEGLGASGVDLNPAKTRAAQDAVQDALADCIMDLQAVLHVISARMRGEDPNISELLGLERPAGQRVFVRTNDPKEQLLTIRDMHREVEALRRHITNTYASGTPCLAHATVSPARPHLGSCMRMLVVYASTYVVRTGARPAHRPDCWCVRVCANVCGRMGVCGCNRRHPAGLRHAVTPLLTKPSCHVTAPALVLRSPDPTCRTGVQFGGACAVYILRTFPKLMPPWLAPPVKPACSPMTVAPASCVSLLKVRFASLASFTPITGPSNLFRCAARPRACIPSTTCVKFFASYKSTVWNKSVAFKPYACAAVRKLPIFSIFLNAILLSLIFLMEPGFNTFIALHSTDPSFNQSANSPSFGDPVNVSSHAVASASKAGLYLPAMVFDTSSDMPKDFPWFAMIV